ncbi:MAG: aspartate carbamoyltransferase [Acidobacteria bacterium 13_1_40CM_2_56_5]|nr:MAG: aspartate carbamoyltransferase [Acidobacteria bacterium 13_1_40CM_2_56_5]
MTRKHLLGIQDLDRQEILEILDTAESFQEVSTRPIKKVPTLRGKTIINLFFEASTRTRTSFEIAGKRLSADVVNVSASTSSVSKGETLIDTAKTLDAMAADCVVIRHSSSGAPNTLARLTKASIINAGDGAHEHPTQALLDAFTIRMRKGRLDDLKVAIIGDVAHSRVARSNVHLLTKFGTHVWLCSTPTLMPSGVQHMVCENRQFLHTTNSMEEAVRAADVIMMLRVQFERMNESFFPSIREYFRYFGLSRRRVEQAKPDVIIMHPGPMNRGVEIATDVADGPYSVILDQVAAGVAVRMSILYLLLGG